MHVSMASADLATIAAEVLDLQKINWKEDTSYFMVELMVNCRGMMVVAIGTEVVDCRRARVKDKLEKLLQEAAKIN